MIVPDPNYRANPQRAIYVQGSINEEKLQHLAPQIIALQTVSREPITVYIDSRGGNVAIAQALLKLLRQSDQDLSPPCRIITVAMGRASSAAADLLTSGDYAIVYPDSTIFYHGVRRSLDNPVTVELGSALTEILRISNDQSAMALARTTEWRFMYRFVLMKSKFNEFRQKANAPSMTDLDCFVALISEKLSSQTRKLVARAQERHGRYSTLLNTLQAAFKKKKSVLNTLAKVHGASLKTIIDFEIRAHRKDPTWNFLTGGLSRLNDNFFLLDEYLRTSDGEPFTKLCERWGTFALTAEETAELEAIADPAARKQAMLKKVRPQFQQLWSFLVALCHVLQEGEENYLTPIDAYWLGLIDEVIGESLPSLRYLNEFRPDPPVEPPAANQAQAAQ